MSFQLQPSRDALDIILEGELSIVDARAFCEAIAPLILSRSAVRVHLPAIASIDTCMMQLLVALAQSGPQITFCGDSSVFRRLAERLALPTEQVFRPAAPAASPAPCEPHPAIAEPFSANVA